MEQPESNDAAERASGSLERMVRPNTYGQKFIRGLLPGTIQFDDPRWWEHPAETVDALRDELEMAWTIIANAGGGDWQKESTEWQAAAAKWRDRYHALIRPNDRTERPAGHAGRSQPEASNER